MKKILWLIPILFLILVSHVYAAEGDINLSEFPQQLATRFGISLFAGQIMACTIILSLFLFPTLLFTRNIFAHLMMGMLSLTLCLALTWLPSWLFILISISVGLLFAGTLRGWMTGRSGE